MRMKYVNLLKRLYKGYILMFIGVYDVGYQCIQFYNYVFCGFNYDSYSIGLGKVINDGECSYYENQMVVFQRFFLKCKLFFWLFWF